MFDVSSINFALQGHDPEREEARQRRRDIQAARYSHWLDDGMDNPNYQWTKRMPENIAEYELGAQLIVDYYSTEEMKR